MTATMASSLWVPPRTNINASPEQRMAGENPMAFCEKLLDIFSNSQD